MMYPWYHDIGPYIDRTDKEHALAAVSWSVSWRALQKVVCPINKYESCRCVDYHVEVILLSLTPFIFTLFPCSGC